MTITEIKKIGSGKRYNLVVDEVFQGVFEAEILARYQLKTGQEIDENFLEQLKKENGDYASFDRALGLLEHGMKSEKQVRDYLLGKSYPPTCVDKAVEKLKEYGYINDYNYAKEYIKLYSNKDGKKKIIFALKQKGVSDEIIDSSIDEFFSEDDELQTCLKVAQKKVKNVEIDNKIKQKLYAYLSSRGFGFDVIKTAVENLTKLKNDDN